MHVNSVFTRFLSYQSVLRSGMATVMLAIFFVASSFAQSSERDLKATHVNLMIRQLGHRLLLQAGDSTSRVLPVAETQEGTFLLEFENEFVFNHDSLMMLSRDLLPKTEFPSGYTVTVHHCKTAIIAYGFEINSSSPDILACSGRREPAGCYSIEISFVDLYKNVELKKAGHKNVIPEKVDRVAAEPKNVDIEQPTKADIDQRTEELTSVNVSPREANSKPEALKTTIFDYPLINLVPSGILVLLCVAMLIGRFGKFLMPAPPLENEDRAIVKASDPNLPALGKFLFDVNHQHLLLGNVVISLTEKEYKILELLYKNFGELISRETLMQKVWINEGVITGRSLDMFVSKLRKKLSSDPELRITNVHGKGYKLEIPGI